MGDDDVSLPRRGQCVVVTFADMGTEEAEDALGAVLPVHHIFHHRVVAELNIGTHRVELQSLGHHLRFVRGSRGNGNGVAAPMELDPNGHVRMQVAVRAEGSEEDARQFATLL